MVVAIIYKDKILEIINVGQPPGGCTKTCTPPQVLDVATCTCKTPPAGCTLTCTPPQVLDVATCTCKTIQSPGTDIFGVDKFYPSVGREWFSTAWANGKKRTLQDNQFDPDDSRFGYTNGNGFVINGDGTASVPKIAPSHRIYVDGPWLNTEATCYLKIKGTPPASFQMRSRSNHHGVKGLPYGLLPNDISCGFGNYEVAWTVNQGIVACELEIIHDLYVRHIAEKPSQVPLNVWVGFKQITRTMGGNKVKLEAWMLRDVGGHNWTKETEFVFDGTNSPCSSATMSTFSNNLSICKDKGDKISSTLNQHQVWLTPAKWCWIRMNEAANMDLKYYSVREIAPLS